MLLVLGTPVTPHGGVAHPWAVRGDVSAHAFAGRPPVGVLATINVGRGPDEWSHVAILGAADDPRSEAPDQVQVGAAAFADALTQVSLSLIKTEAITKRFTTGLSVRVEDSIQCLLFSNPFPGADREFNAWYTDQHLPDILDVPGYVSAQRFRILNHKDRIDPMWRYCTRYEISADDYDAAINEVRLRSGTKRMPMSSAVGAHLSAHFEPYAWWDAAF